MHDGCPDSFEEYNQLYIKSIKYPEKFWEDAAKRISWFSKWDKISTGSFNGTNIKWFEGGKLNACYNCLDRHVESGNGEKTALIWEGNDRESRKLSYNDLLIEVKKFSNVLKKNGVKRGDRVCIYMQMVPEAIIAMLSCARIGAIHSVVFGAFSAESLRDRITNMGAKLLITQDSANRGAKKGIPMKDMADEAVRSAKSIKKVIVVNRNNSKIKMRRDRDVFWHDEIKLVDGNSQPELMNAEDPLFILYTSGSTGKPKGVLHSTGGYLVQCSHTQKLVFGLAKEDVYWCTADIGWITGHSYGVYGPLSNAATIVTYEGIPNYPDPGRAWEIIQRYNVTILYTSPTAIRSLMKEGNSWPKKYNLNSLRVLGSVGEPLNEPEWNWYNEVIGKRRCPIVDTWWQTETGAILISPIAHVTPKAPGSVSLPLFGIEPVILNDKGEELSGECKGLLAIKSPWPSIARTLYKSHKLFKEIYFSRFPGYYLTGDEAKRDSKGYYWIIGRADDIINVSGHRIGTAEVESAICKTKGVVECAVVGYPHGIKGQAICAVVTPMKRVSQSEELKERIKAEVRKHIGPHAVPDRIEFVSSLPKTRSGKIMRRIIRKVINEGANSLGDLSTLADKNAVEEIIKKLS